MALGGADMSLVAATLGVRVAAQAASSQAQREPMMVHGITPTSMLTPDLLASRASRAPRRQKGEAGQGPFGMSGGLGGCGQNQCSVWLGRLYQPKRSGWFRLWRWGGRT